MEVLSTDCGGEHHQQQPNYGNTSTHGAPAMAADSSMGATIVGPVQWWGSNASPDNLVAPGIVSHLQPVARHDVLSLACFHIHARTSIPDGQGCYRQRWQYRVSDRGWYDLSACRGGAWQRQSGKLDHILGAPPVSCIPRERPPAPHRSAPLSIARLSQLQSM